jgi:1-acyl-sn-glycerol-3-phosphate acyltransferase
MLRSTLFNLIFYVWSATNTLLHLYTFFLPKEFQLRAMWRWGRDVNRLMKVVAGTDVEIRGAENLPDGPFIVVAKHQSAWDTIAWLYMLRYPAIVMKSDLFFIPVYGQLCWKAGHIIIDRKGAAAALRKLLQLARKAKSEGRPVLIFPQGTRTEPDASTEDFPYQPGAAALYRDLKIPVVPVALNSGLFWPRRAWLRHPGTIIVEYLEPIAPGMNRKLFQKELEVRIEAATKRLVAEGRAEIARLNSQNQGETNGRNKQEDRA